MTYPRAIQKSGINVTVFIQQKSAGRIKLHIPYSMHKARATFKSLNGTFYHPHQKLWSIPNTEENNATLKRIFADKIQYKETEQVVKQEAFILNKHSNEALLNNLKTLTLKGYSKLTINAYQNCLAPFLHHFQEKDLAIISKVEIENYLYLLITKYKIGAQKQNQVINAIKSFYEHTLGQDRTRYTIQRPKKSKTLPNVLSENEVLRLINAPKTLNTKLFCTHYTVQV